MPQRLVDAFGQRGVPVLQVYGSTETCPIAVYTRLAGDWRRDYRHLANAVVILTGVKRAAADAVVTNEKCRFGPRVQVARSRVTSSVSRAMLI